MQTLDMQSVALVAGFDNDDNAEIHVVVWINENPENPELREVQCVGAIKVSLGMIQEMLQQMDVDGQRTHNVVEMVFNDDGSVLQYYGEEN